MNNYFVYDTLIGKLIITDNSEAITGIHFERYVINHNCVEKETNLIKETKTQLDQYFKGQRKSFNIPLTLKGTGFQISVWDELIKIPYGETRSYSQVASNIANPKACRAVGLANNKNPISIIIPCHRVIGKNGKLVGYGGGLSIKEKLLELEENYKYID